MAYVTNLMCVESIEPVESLEFVESIRSTQPLALGSQLLDESCEHSLDFDQQSH